MKGLGNKKINRAAASVLMCLTALTVFASCGKKDKEDNNDSETVTATEDTVLSEELKKAKAFAGEWTDDDHNAILDIWVGNDAVVHGEIIVTHAENELTFWSFTGTMVEEEVVYLDCERVDAHYDEAGNINEESIYTRGRGNIGFAGNCLYWVDSKEDAGNGFVFNYFGEY